MPQFDPAPFLSQVIWLTLCFVIFNIAMVKWLIPRLRQAIEGREKKILANRKKAQALLTEASQLSGKIEENLHQARHDARQMMHNSLHDLAEQQKQRLAQLDTDLNKKFEDYDAKLKHDLAHVQRELFDQVEAYSKELTQTLFSNGSSVSKTNVGKRLS